MDRRNLRWWVSPPVPDESLRSLLGRVADLYESEPGELWSRLNAGDPQAAGEIDDPSCAALLRMGQALGVPGGDGQPGRLLEAVRSEEHAVGELAELVAGLGAQAGLREDRCHEARVDALGA